MSGGAIGPEASRPIVYGALKRSDGDELTAADRHLVVDVIHDGDRMPASQQLLDRLRSLDPEAARRFELSRVVERDHGATLFAEHLADELGLSRIFSFGISRALVDFNRFEGVTRKGEATAERRALFGACAEAFSDSECKALLEEAYLPASKALKEQTELRLGTQVPIASFVRIAVHTYDRFGSSGVERPPFSLLYRPESIQRTGALVRGNYADLIPDEIAKSTAAPALIASVQRRLAEAGLRAGDNDPYLLPDGSVEVRLIVWLFSRFLRQVVEQDFGDSIRDEFGQTACAKCWAHIGSPIPQGSWRTASPSRASAPRLLGMVGESRDPTNLAYARIQELVNRHRSELVAEFINSPVRPSTFSIEIRKDLLYLDYTDSGARQGREPTLFQNEVARRAAQIVAAGVADYLSSSRLA